MTKNIQEEPYIYTLFKYPKLFYLWLKAFLYEKIFSKLSNNQ